MFSQAQQLIAQRMDGNLLILFVPLAPFFPGIATAPAGHNENSVAIGAFDERFVFEFPLQTNGIQPQFTSRSGIPLHAGIRPPRSIMSGAQPPPLTSTGLPFTFSKRFPSEVNSESVWTIPKWMDRVSEIAFCAVTKIQASV